MRNSARQCFASLVVVSAGFGLVLSLEGAERQVPKLKPGQYNPEHETIELFDGIKAGQLEAKFIPKDSTQARVFITNKSKKPLNVKLPNAFAGVPVLAQAGAGYAPGGSTIGQNVGGGGLGGGGLGGGGLGGGMGAFNIPAEKVGEFKGECVCLEHGKAEPRPNMKYEIRPIESVAQDPAVHELCKMLGSGQMSQVAAQAAAWRLSSGMSWQQLEEKFIERADGERQWYFTDEELAAAKRITAEVERRAEGARQPENPIVSPGEAATSDKKI